MAARIRFALLMFGVLALPLGSRAAYSQSVAPRPRFEIGGTFGLSFIALDGAKTGTFCGGLTTSTHPVVGVRGGYKVTKWLGVEVTLETIRDNGEHLVYLCQPPKQPRASGPDTLRTSFPTWERTGFDPSIATTARLVLIPWSASGGDLRVYAGVGRIWQNHLLPVIAGLNGRVNLGGASLFGEAEADRSAVPFSHEAAIYQDGVLLRTEVTTSHEARLDVTIRIGMSVPL